MGDTGTGSANQRAVAESIKLYCAVRSCQAVFILGDVIYEEGVKNAEDRQFTSKFETPYQDIELPFYIAFGNHDYLGCTKCYLDYARSSTRWRMPDYYYSQPFGNDLEVFVVDTERFNASQAEWLENEITRSSAKWKVVTGHRPLISYETSKAYENWNGKSELQSAVCDDTNLYISGHAHVMERNEIVGCKTSQIVSGGGGASLREFVEENKSIFSSSSYGFFSISYKGQKLTGEFVDSGGRVLHSFVLGN